MKFAIVGFGGRGTTYAHFIKEYGHEVVAVCDTNSEKKTVAKSYGVEDKYFFTDEEEFFKQGKIADALVVSTLDTLHFRQTIKGLELGYDILLEKPIATTQKECEEIEKKTVETGRKVVVCHVLRYAPIYLKLKEIIDSKEFGDIVTMYLSEDIGFYHYAHSYARGNWRNEKVSTPLILAKNCHDLDLACWFLGTNCISVSSNGGLKVFKPENAPKGSADHCVDCKYRQDCIYSCFSIYNNQEFERLAGLAKHGKLGETEEEINANLSDKNNLYSRCVYKCDNDVCDHQTVNMQFENGVTVVLMCQAFSLTMSRDFKIYCTKGMLYNDNGNIGYEKFSGEKGSYKIITPEGGYANHSGGDVGIVKQFAEYIKNGIKTVNITEIGKSVLSHKIGFFAEQSRKNGGKTFYL